MTIPEAVRLVLQAGAIGRPGEVLILDMGEPVRIADLAKQLIDHAGAKVEIVYTGLRPGEKMHEILVAAAERGEHREHPRITHTRSEVPVRALDALALSRAENTAEILRFADAVRPIGSGGPEPIVLESADSGSSR
ncbi:MAG: polysaccharide biosynthesis protein [Acidimicrobiales bacterium]